MHEAKLKEFISENFVRSLILHSNVSINKIKNDSGEDLFVDFQRTCPKADGSGLCYYSYDKLYLQLKARTQSNITETDEHIKYERK